MLHLETPRLRLRPLNETDAVFIVELLNDPAFLRFIGDRGVRTPEDARAYIARGPVASYERFGHGLLLVSLKAGETPIGICGLVKRDTLPDVDIGFAFLPAFYRLGYGFEAASTVLEDGRRSLGLTRIVAITDPGNIASIRLLEKLGLSFERLIEMPGDGKTLRLHAWGERGTKTGPSTRRGRGDHR